VENDTGEIKFEGPDGKIYDAVKPDPIYVDSKGTAHAGGLPDEKAESLLPLEKTPSEINTTDLGKLIDHGGNKDVYALGEKQVVAILQKGKNSELITRELDMLNELKDLGIPTVDAGPVKVNGQPAMLMDRFAQGSKSVVALKDGKVRIVGESSYLNSQSVADLEKIRQTMIDKNIKIDDLQFLIGKNGEIVVADPLKIYQGAAPSKNNLRMIQLLIEQARKN
jgi:hypothetical protein